MMRIASTRSNGQGTAPGDEPEQNSAVAPSTTAATAVVEVEQESATETTHAMALSRMVGTSATAPPTSVPSPTVRPRILSDFDMSRMPVIHRRALHSWSVHRSLTNGKFIATVARATSASSSGSTSAGSSYKLKHVQFPFPTEREARKFCKAYSPPRIVTDAVGACMLCQNTVASSSSPPSASGSNNNSGALLPQPPSQQQQQQPNHHPCLLRARHCRNCGAVICERCTHRWGLRMVPKTYVPQIATTVRVCKSCNWLSNAFCMALLQGRGQDARLLFETGNVNLRTSFADIHSEAMFPVHCAVMGGSIDLVRWLVDTHLCPVSVTRGSKGQLLSVQTSARRTLLDVAMTGRPKMDILAYLVSKGLSLTDVKDPSLPTKTLEAMLKCSNAGQLIMHNNNSFRATSPVGVAVIANDDVDMMDAEDHDESVTTATSSDHCALCCERPMDCVLTPCGHQICCNECAQQIQTCPICKVKCSALRIFRQ